MHRTVKRLAWLAIGAAAAAGVVLSFRPRPVLIDTATVTRGPLVVTVRDDGFTRVRERFTISAPIRGRLIRTPLDAGDPVHKGETVVAEFAPLRPDPLDDRSLDEARARLRQAEVAVQEATAREKQAHAERDYQLAERARIEKLVAQEIATEEALELARRNATRAEEGLRAAAFQVEMARFGAALARASLRDAEPGPGDDKHREFPATGDRPTLRLRSPVEGRVLRVFEESTRILAAGTPILELGDLRQLEIVADFLTQDAVEVRAGMQVAIAEWAGTDEARSAANLRGKVRHVEPSGFTKISALGVEEQRVNIVIDPDEGGWAPLGDGFRVVPHIELWRADDVLQVPAGALFRQAGDWAVFVVRGGTARRQPVRIGRRSGLQAQVLAGLNAGDPVILYPSDLVDEGTPVQAR